MLNSQSCAQIGKLDVKNDFSSQGLLLQELKQWARVSRTKRIVCTLADPVQLAIEVC